MEEFERVLKQLAEAEAADEELHRRNSTLEERVRSHDQLARLRAEVARIRTRLRLEKMPVKGRDPHST